MKLGLGAAQFGMSYGIANASGKVSQEEVKILMQFARDNGIDVVDTASSYGDSESVLGGALPRHHQFRIVTKTPVFKAELADCREEHS